jgi:hypothetical protein
MSGKTTMSIFLTTAHSSSGVEVLSASSTCFVSSTLGVMSALCSVDSMVCEYVLIWGRTNESVCG